MRTQQQLMDDQKLVSLYIQGNETALETLILRHKRRLFSYIMTIANDRDLAEDVFQETFFKVINTLRKGQYNEEGKFLPWVERIAHNLLIDHFRKDNRMSTVSGGSNEDGEEFDIFDLISNGELNAEQEISKRQLNKDIRKMVVKLPEDQREVLMMRHYYDMSFKEIADSTNVSINTALGRMRYALINLRKMIEEHGLVMSA
ncbi:MAG: sigma-70 family RNA polymerase sigma factor [Bacteroidetes bacterium]|nr:sigma-70 family RNA polymerase sigma factor [Bacteroidota bacterium]